MVAVVVAAEGAVAAGVADIDYCIPRSDYCRFGCSCRVADRKPRILAGQTLAGTAAGHIVARIAGIGDIRTVDIAGQAGMRLHRAGTKGLVLGKTAVHCSNLCCRSV